MWAVNAHLQKRSGSRPAKMLRLPDLQDIQKTSQPRGSKPMSYYIHQIPGRLRIKSPVVRRNEAVAVTVETFLKTIDGIRSVAVNTLTGSITIHYSPRVVTPEIVLEALKCKGYFDASKAKTHDQVIYSAASNVGFFLSKTVSGAALETAFEGSALSLIAALI